MGDIKAYLLSVTAAAVFCSIIKSLVGEKSTVSGLIKILCGIFMACTLIRPVISLDLSAVSAFGQSFTSEAEAAANIGKSAAAKEMDAVIKSKMETYILDKAAAMEADLNVEVTVENWIPTGVLIRGPVSPHTKTTLSDWIVQQLGIPKEAQIWNGER